VGSRAATLITGPADIVGVYLPQVDQGEELVLPVPTGSQQGCG
jgi:hypothetical protein